MVNSTYMLAITKANEYHLTGSYAIKKSHIKLIHVGFNIVLPNDVQNLGENKVYIKISLSSFSTYQEYLTKKKTKVQGKSLSPLSSCGKLTEKITVLYAYFVTTNYLSAN